MHRPWRPHSAANEHREAKLTVMNTTGDSEAKPNTRPFTWTDDAGNVIGAYLDHPGEPCAFHPSTGICDCGRLNIGIVPEPIQYPTLTIRFCTTWDRVDWNHLVAPRYTAVAAAIRKPARRLSHWWRNR